MHATGMNFLWLLITLMMLLIMSEYDYHDNRVIFDIVECLLHHEILRLFGN